MKLQEWEDYIESKTRISAIIIFDSCNNLPGYKERVISFILFSFEEGITIIALQENMKLSMSDIVELYKDTIIGHLVNTVTPYLFIHIV